MKSARSRRAPNAPPRETPAALRAWKRRWEAVNARQLDELRRMTPEEKFDQLAVLMAAAEDFGWNRKLEAETSEVRRKWVRLKKAKRGQA